MLSKRIAIFFITWIERDIILSIRPIDHPSGRRWKRHLWTRGSYTIRQHLWGPGFVPWANSHLFLIEGSIRRCLEFSKRPACVCWLWTKWDLFIPYLSSCFRFCWRIWTIFTWEKRTYNQGWEFAHCSFTHSLISLKSNERLWGIPSDRTRNMSDREWIAQIAQDNWATMSKSLRSLITNEWPWAIRSGRSW